MSKPWERYGSGEPAGQVFTMPPDPIDAAKEARAQAAERRAIEDQDRQNRRDQREFGKDVIDRTMKLRDDFNAQQTTKDYMAALPIYADALKTPPTAQGDLALTYAFAKIMDPGSVVREGEQAAAASTQAMAEQIAAQFGKQVLGGGAFTADARQKMREAVAGRMGAINRAYIDLRVRYKDDAKAFNIDPARVVGAHPGASFQSAEAKFLGRPITQLDYRGKPVATPSGPGTSTDESSPPPPPTGPIATGEFRNERDDKASALVDSMIRQGVSAEQATAALQAMGYPDGVNPAQYQEAQAHFRKNPSFKGSYGSIERKVEQSLVQRAASTPLGTGVGSFLNASVGGIPQLLAGEQGKAAMDAVAAENPKAALAGNFAGGLVGSVATSGLASLAGLGARAAPVAGNLAYSTLLGADTAAPGERLEGAGKGLAGGLAGEGLGRAIVAPALRWAGNTAPVAAATNQARGIFGARPLAALPAPIPAEQRLIAGAVGDRAATVGTLREAAGLNLPMTLADASPGLRSLGGSAVRRSPNARAIAEQSLNPRHTGQIDRLTAGMDRDFGPGVNIPEQVDAILQRARQQAGPSYDAAYAAPGASSVQINDIVGTPVGQSALNNARRMVLNNRGDPTALGFDLNEAGEAVLNRVPSFETLDYTKRALDDIAEAAKDNITGRYNYTGKPEARAANDLRRDLTSRVDAVNPAYADARAAYAGPAMEREALVRGTRAINETPDTIRYTLDGMNDNNADLYRLGFREKLGQRADQVRYNQNPYELIAGSPAAQERLSTVFPEGAARFIRQYNLENQMARTRNEVLGGSQTAERQIADQGFAINPAVQAGADILQGVVAGGPSAATGLNMALKFVKDRAALGWGRAAERRADAVAPIVFDQNAAAMAAQVEGILASARTRDTLLGQARRKAGRQGGIFGAGMAAPVIVEANR